MRLDVILFVLTRSGLLCDTIGTTDTPKTDFVDVLKQDLRKNNDDYIESTTVSVDVPNPYLLRTTESLNNTENKHNQTLLKEGKYSYRRGPSNTNNLIINTKNVVTPQRRSFDSLESKSVEATTNKSETTIRFITRNATVRSVRTTRTTRTLPRSTTLKIVTNVLKFNRSVIKEVANFRSSDKKEDNKESAKINKIKNFIERNKQLFNEFMYKKRMEVRAPAPAPREPAPAGVPREGAAAADDSELSSEDSGGGLRMRAHYDGTSLRPDQLDMAPAKGGHVHALRVKGRLCQRSVLVPEGPKYDSRGQQYLGAYGHAGGRLYNRTRSPALLLPRCCNCCRKSLLGCE